MALKAPNWCEHAIPGLNGWEDPDTGEVFASTKFTEEDLAEYWGTAPKAAPEPEETIISGYTVSKVPSNLESMSKKQLEELGREYGVELDRRQSKPSLIQKMKEITAPK